MKLKDGETLLGHLRILRRGDVSALLRYLLAFVPGKVWKLFHRDVWVVSELAENARDNGYWLFRYLREQHPEVEAYYPIRRDASDRSRVAGLGNVVDFGSWRHYLLFWAASRYIGTTMQHGFPVGRAGYFFATNGLAQFKYVFLNHGVARGYSGIVDGKRTNYDLLIAISEQERQTIVSLCNQPADKVKAIGFCRHDNLGDDLLESDLVLVMPTWRRWLDSRHEDDLQRVAEIREAFLASDYHLRNLELVCGDRMLDLLERRNLRLVFYLHGYAQGYASCYESPSPRVEVARKEDYFVQDLLKRAAYLVTDYSSVIFDFAYMKKPCCYYQYDAEQFALEQYAESEFFTYERDGFGPVFHELDEVLADIERAHDRGFTMVETYRRRVEGYFPSFDREHCRRTYELVAEL